ncbi:MAG: hypothetical protein AAFX09_08630 [Pseudomonadota bacterium]
MGWRTIRVGIAALGVALGLGAVGQAQEPFYAVRVDPTSADAHVIAHPDALVDERPFWLQAERYIGQPGLCRSAEDGPARVTALDFTASYQSLAVTGFSSALAWFTDQGLYPFGSITLDAVDPRAPAGYPIFCQEAQDLDSDPLDGKLRPIFFSFQQSVNLTRAYLFANVTAPGNGPRDDRRVILGAGFTLAELWDYGRRAASGNEELGPNWLHTAAYDALTIAAARANGHTFYDDYENIEQRLPFLQGAYHQRLSQPDDANGLLQTETTSGAFIRFVMERHVTDRWATLDPLLTRAATSDDPMSAIDAFIDSQDGDMRGLEHAFPAFVADQASLGYLYEQYDSVLTSERWLEDNFGGCEDVIISEVSPTGTRTLTVEPYAARCVRLQARAEHAAWNGKVHLRTQLSGAPVGDERINRVFVSGAGFGKGPVETGLVSACYTNVDEDGNGRSCILTPSTQGTDADQSLQRYYSFALEERAPDEQQWFLMLVSYVPDRGQHAGSPAFPAVDVELTFSADTVIGDPGDLADMGSSGEFELIDMATASLNHGSKIGLAPISAGLSGTATDQNSILDGTATPVDGGLIEQMMAGADSLLQFVDEAGDSVGFVLTDPSILTSGFTGRTTEFAAVVSKEGYIGIPDPDAESSIEIIENTPDTLHFIAEDGFCMVPQDQYVQLLQQTNGDLCEAAERVSARSEATLAFPPTRRSETKIEAVETEEFRALRQFRIDRINERMGQQFNLGAPGGAAPTRGPNQSPTGPSNPSANPVGERPVLQSCPIRDAAEACDCSCEANTCLQSLISTGAATAQDRSCRLTCGRAWMQCPTP